MKKISFLSLLLVGGLTLSACTQSSKPATTPSKAQQAQQKQGETIMSGTVIEAGGNYYLQTPAGERQIMKSYNLELSTYAGKSVTATGQFSGDELFVTTIK